MKQNYIKPEMTVEEIAVESMLAASTDRTPVGGSGIKPSASNGYHGSWDDLWE